MAPSISVLLVSALMFLSCCLGEPQKLQDVVESLQESIKGFHDKSNAPADSLQILLEDLQLVTDHLERVDDIVNSQAAVIKEDIVRVMADVRSHDDRLKKEVQTTYMSFQSRLQQIRTNIEVMVQKGHEDSLTDVEKFQELVEDLLDDWKQYLMILVGGVVLVTLGFVVYFIHLQQTIIRDRKNV